MSSTDVFKFVTVRPPQAAEPKSIRIRFASYTKGRSSPLHTKLQALEGSDARVEATEIAADHLASREYRGLVAELRDARSPLPVPGIIEKASAEPVLAKAQHIVEDILGVTIDGFLDTRAGQLRDRLWDAVYAQALAPDESPEDRDTIYMGVRALHFIELLAEETSERTPISGPELRRVRPTIPTDLVPGAPDAPSEDLTQVRTEVMARLKAIHTRILDTQVAIKDLENTHRLHQEAQRKPESTPSSPRRAPVARRLNAHEFAASLEKLPKVDPQVFAVLPTLRHFEGVPEPKSWVFSDFGAARLKRETTALLKERKGQFLEKHPADIIDDLEKDLSEEVTTFVKTLTPEEFEVIGDAKELPDVLSLTPVIYDKLKPVPFKPKPGPLKPTFPSSKRRGIRPLGIGDLLVVKEELLKYTTGELAHIENVLQGEYKEREHRRLHQLEETIITETERMEESEKDLQTTERFELHKESQETISSDVEFSAGVEVSGSYGMVKFGAHADFATSTSREESNSSASTYAKDVTERSVQKIMTRAREERSRRSLEEIEETNKHGIDNKNGADHVIGVYRWVDKYYKARIHNYGRRLMFEFIIPEPGAFFIHSQAYSGQQALTATPPEEPLVYSGGGYRKLRPSDLNSGNYMQWVSKYDVQDAEAPPPATVTVGMAFGESAGQKDNVPTGKGYKELQVPDGYKADWRAWSAGWMGKDDNWYEPLGLRIGKGGSDNDVYGIEGIVPISVEGCFSNFAMNVVIGCQRKTSHYNAWKLKTYTAIMSAHGRLLAEYNERAAAASIQQGIAISGRNPDINRSIERDELRKGCLQLLTNDYAHTKVGGIWRHHEQFDAMKPSGSYGFPEFRNSEALVEGKIIQFFEQAFEWENLTYLFYPYFWGRKNNWLEAFPLNDTDPKFRDFLRAGAARVIVPVHPAYNEAVLHYLTTNVIWNGGQPPTLYDPMYLSIVEEIKAASGADEGEIIDEWEVKLPTTLVYLQKDASLPDYSAVVDPGDDDG